MSYKACLRIRYKAGGHAFIMFHHKPTVDHDMIFRDELPIFLKVRFRLTY